MPIKQKFTMTTTAGNGETHYARMLPAPFEIDTASLSDLVAVMQWCKWEIKDWKKILKDEIKGGDQDEIDEANDEISKTEAFLDAVESEVAERLLPTLNQYGD